MLWEQFKKLADNWQPSQDPLDYGPPFTDPSGESIAWGPTKPPPGQAIPPGPGGWWYHHAPTVERARIQEHGLVPSNPNNNPNWGTIDSQPEGVYFTNSPERMKSLWPTTPVDTWRVPADNLEVKGDPLIRERAVYTPHPVTEPELFRPYEKSNEYANRYEDERDLPRYGPRPEDWVNYQDYHEMGLPSDEEWASYGIGQDPETWRTAAIQPVHPGLTGLPAVHHITPDYNYHSDHPSDDAVFYNPDRRMLFVAPDGGHHSELAMQLGNKLLGDNPLAAYVDRRDYGPMLDISPAEWHGTGMGWDEQSIDHAMQALDRWYPGLYQRGVMSKVGSHDYYYHVAPRDQRERIQAHGLHPGRPTWDNYAPERLDYPSEGMVNQPQGIYVQRSPLTARDWKEGWGDKDVWRIPRSSVSESYPDPLVRGALYITHPVNAELFEPGQRDESNAWHEHINYPANQERPNYYPDQEKPPVFGWGWQGPKEISEHPEWGIGKPDRVIGKTASALQWQPGQWGKGLTVDGRPHTWTTEGPGASPHHQQYLQQIGRGQPETDTSRGVTDGIVIAPDGSYTLQFGYQGENPVDPSLLARVQPGMRYVQDQDRWSLRAFGSRMADVATPMGWGDMYHDQPAMFSAWHEAGTSNKPWEAKMYHGKPNGRGIMGPVRPPFWTTSFDQEALGFAGGDGFEGNVHPVSVRFQRPAHYFAHATWGPESLEDARQRGADGVVVHWPADERDPSDPYPARTWAIALDPGAVVPGHLKDSVTD